MGTNRDEGGMEGGRRVAGRTVREDEEKGGEGKSGFSKNHHLIRDASYLNRIGISAQMPGYTVNVYPDMKSYPGSRAMFILEIRDQLFSG